MTLVDFYVGLPDPHTAGQFERSMISLNRLRRVRRGRMRERQRDFPVRRWLMDSGAFTEITQHGQHRTPVATYAASIVRWSRCGTLEGAAVQDWMCEDFVLARTGLSVPEHQRLTTENYHALRQLVPSPLYVMPVLQGYQPADYVAHVEAYGPALTPGMWVGVGSVCKRNAAPDAVAGVLRAIKAVRPDLRLHGYGLKITALGDATVRDLLQSADSMAWSYHARKHRRNSNAPHEAAQFVRRVATMPVQGVLPL